MTTLFEIAAAQARMEARATLRLPREHNQTYHPAEVYEMERVLLARDYGVSPWGPPDCGAEWKP